MLRIVRPENQVVKVMRRPRLKGDADEKMLNHATGP